ncbi:hypothetical protein [Bacillus sp. PS06]|uniref:hypothetical protein n=1 Tax=Bacillus sp. PS06 TaxID=2764176 RepID=UPI0017865885|nr:hypothetical protein [Bacillus sp. PS06]MBD8067387.1 hypothetical protein [Bacillus sp. PS06]
MFELILDFNNLYSIYSLYFSLLLGLSIKIALNCGLDHTLIGSLYHSTRIKVCAKSKLHVGSQLKHRNTINQWIAKVVRRKLCPGDDSEEMNNLPVF